MLNSPCRRLTKQCITLPPLKTNVSLLDPLTWSRWKNKDHRCQYFRITGNSWDIFYLIQVTIWKFKNLNVQTAMTEIGFCLSSLWVIGFYEFDQHPLSGGDSGLMGFYQIHRWCRKTTKTLLTFFTVIVSTKTQIDMLVR